MLKGRTFWYFLFSLMLGIVLASGCGLFEGLPEIPGDVFEIDQGHDGATDRADERNSGSEEIDEDRPSQPKNGEEGESGDLPDRVENGITVFVPHPRGFWMEAVEVEDPAIGTPVENRIAAWENAVDVLPPVEIHVFDLDIANGVLTVSFSKEIETMESDYEDLIVQSLVNTVAALDTVSRVQIWVDEEARYTLAGSSYIEEPLPFDDDLVATATYTPLAPADPRRGERFVEGRLVKLGRDEAKITIEATETGLERTYTLAGDVVIHQQDPVSGGKEQVKEEALELGDEVGIIVEADGHVRGILLFRN